MKYFDGKKVPPGATHYNKPESMFYMKLGETWAFFDVTSWVPSLSVKDPDFELDLTKIPADDSYKPEVGTWCEFDCTAKGQECKNFAGYVEYMSEFTCVIKLKYPSRKAEFVAHPKTMKFRPLKTEHQRTAEAMYEVITRDDAHLHAESLFAMCEALTNAGYRKS